MKYGSSSSSKGNIRLYAYGPRPFWAKNKNNAYIIIIIVINIKSLLAQQIIIII